MNITWEEIAGSPRRVQLSADGEPIRRLSCSIVPLRVLSSIAQTDGFFVSLQEHERKGVLRYALYQLSRRSMHSSALEKALQRHCVGPELIEVAVEYCRSHGFLNDESWIERRVETWQARGKSPAAIKAQLRVVGVRLDQTLDERQPLRVLIQRKYPKLLESDLSYEEKAKIFQALQRRGFSFSAIQEVLRSGLCR